MESGEKEDRIGEHNKNNYEALGEKKKLLDQRKREEWKMLKESAAIAL